MIRLAVANRSSVCNCLLVVVLSWAASVSYGGEFEDSDFGYAFSPPNLGVPAAGTILQRLTVGGPSVENFAPNVNVQVQQVKLTRDAYITSSEKQFAEAKMTVLEKTMSEIDGSDAVTFQYEWKIENMTFRFLSLAVFREDHVLLVTCTTKAADFAKHEEIFRKSLQSFRLTKK